MKAVIIERLQEYDSLILPARAIKFILEGVTGNPVNMICQPSKSHYSHGSRSWRSQPERPEPALGDGFKSPCRKPVINDETNT
jgi:hypothetical protein